MSTIVVCPNCLTEVEPVLRKRTDARSDTPVGTNGWFDRECPVCSYFLGITKDSSTLQPPLFGSSK